MFAFITRHSSWLLCVVVHVLNVSDITNGVVSANGKNGSNSGADAGGATAVL